MKFFGASVIIGAGSGNANESAKCWEAIRSGGYVNPSVLSQINLQASKFPGGNIFPHWAKVLEFVVNVEGSPSLKVRGEASGFATRHGLNGHDAFCIMSAAELGCTEYVTLTADNGKKFGDIVVRNPLQG